MASLSELYPPKFFSDGSLDMAEIEKFAIPHDYVRREHAKRAGPQPPSAVMVNQTIHLCDLTENVLHKETPYKFLKPKKWAWIARSCWWVLKKLSALEAFSEKVTTYTYDRVAQDAVDKLFMESIDAIFANRQNPADFAFLIGGKTFQEATGSPTFREMVRFNMGRVHHDRNGYRGDFSGIPIIVNPFMEGIAVLPKIIVERYPDGDHVRT